MTADTMKLVREALAFYADKVNYKMGTDWVFNGEDEHGVDAPSDADLEGGKKARAALAILDAADECPEEPCELCKRTHDPNIYCCLIHGKPSEEADGVCGECGMPQEHPLHLGVTLENILYPPNLYHPYSPACNGTGRAEGGSK